MGDILVLQKQRKMCFKVDSIGLLSLKMLGNMCLCAIDVKGRGTLVVEMSRLLLTSLRLKFLMYGE